jgi:hypothetical protein
MPGMTDVDNEIIETLEIAVSRAAAEHTRLSWDLQLMKAKRAEKAAATAAAIEKAAMKRQGKLVDLPSDPTARAIVMAGRKARNEIQ